MDPSYNNNLGGFGTGGQPVPPAQPGQFGQPVFGGGMPGGAPSGVPQAPIGTGGDVMLTPASAPKKSRKGLVVGIIVVLILIGGGIAAVNFLNSSGILASNKEKTFYQYANYILYGESSTKPLTGEYNADEIYTIDELIHESDDEDTESEEGDDGSGILATEFFATADELWEKFNSALDDKSPSLTNELNDYRENYELVKLTATKEIVDSEDIETRIASMAPSVAKTWVTSQYQDFTNSSYQLVKEYGQNVVRYYDLYVDYVNSLREAGCVDEDDAIVCETDDYAAVTSAMDDLFSKIEDARDNANNKVVEGCWTITDLLKGKKSNSEGSDK